MLTSPAHACSRTGERTRDIVTFKVSSLLGASEADTSHFFCKVCVHFHSVFSLPLGDLKEEKVHVEDSDYRFEWSGDGNVFGATRWPVTVVSFKWIRWVQSFRLSQQPSVFLFNRNFSISAFVPRFWPCKFRVGPAHYANPPPHCCCTHTHTNTQTIVSSAESRFAL